MVGDFEGSGVGHYKIRMSRWPAEIVNNIDI